MKFKSQLRRTQPDLVRQIDEALTRSIKNAGGKVTGDRFVISSVFNEETIGFWLDMFILIETMKKSMEESVEFFGYSLLITNKQPESVDLLCRYLASYSGVFMEREVAKKLLPYASFERPTEWLKKMKNVKYGGSGYYRIREIKTFRVFPRSDLDLQKYVISTFEKEEKDILIIGPFFLQMRDGLNKFCDQLNGDFPRLSICFESIGIGALIDVWSSGVRALGGRPTEEIDNLWNFLFKERLRDEVSEYVARCAARFLFLIFDFYTAAAEKRKRVPVLTLENIHLAEKNVMALVIDTILNINSKSPSAADNRKKLKILGTGEDSILYETLNKWEPVFSNIFKFNDIKLDSLRFPKLSADIWEIIYAISLFNRYFSPELVLRLFEEEEKNPLMISRALSILYSFGIIDNLRSPRLMNRHYEDYAVKVLEGPRGETTNFRSEASLSRSEASSSRSEASSSRSEASSKADRVRLMVCSRLLNWAVRQNINPCFRLLSIIVYMGGQKKIDDLLLLKSISYDIVNKTTSTIEAAVNKGQFKEMFIEKAFVVQDVFDTSRALITGNEKEIDSVFSNDKFNDLSKGYEDFPILKTQLVVNLCGYFLGRHDEKRSAEKAKEAILLGQRGSQYCLPQAYRLFSLSCLSKKQVNETIEYLGFALDNAEKTGNYHEMAVSAYYAAAAQFLYGDVYNAMRLARKSIEQSLSAGRPDWADRSRFLEGRIEFDLGHYSAAHDIFENMRKKPYGSRTDEKENLLSVWVYRSKLYFIDPRTPKPQPANHDADLFEVEAAYLAGNYKKAYELSTMLGNTFSDVNFLYTYTEQADWRSGFAQCEHLFFTNGEVQSRMISLFHSLALSRLPKQEMPNGREEAVRDIQQILRDERLCEMDPWDAFYFYAKYRILEQSSASLVDMSTAVSMAFKRLQRRAGRIDDIETRRQYLNGSRWNRELSAAAKEFKLI